MRHYEHRLLLTFNKETTSPIQKDYRTEGRRQVERDCGCVSMEKGEPLNGKVGGFGSDGGVMPRTLEVGAEWRRM